LKLVTCFGDFGDVYDIGVRDCLVMGNLECSSYVGQLKDVDCVVTAVS